ncbi:MAG: hypothetical protein ACI9U2_002836, partial [Bradymonadia bacterium]
MICSRCTREIPDGSKFCGLCGGKQGDAAAETLVGPGAASTIAGAQAMVGGQAPSEVIAGGRRFAALSAGPAARPPVITTPPAGIVIDTLSEGVPAGAIAALIAARRPPADAGSTPSAMSATLLGSPALPRAHIDARSAATEPDRPAMGAVASQLQPGKAAPTIDTVPKGDWLIASDTVESLAPAPADLMDQAIPSLGPTPTDLLDATAAKLPAAAPDLAVAAATDTPAEPDHEGVAPASEDAITMKRPRRVRPSVSTMASVIVDSEFDLE